MKIRTHKKKNYCGIAALLAAAVLFLSGCEMGKATGPKTLAAIDALDAGEYQQAQQLFAEAARDGEQQMLAYRGLGIAYMGLAQYGQAAEAFEAALACTDSRMEENVQDIQLYLATAQFRAEHYDETIAVCDDILDAAENADAYYLRGASRLHEDYRDEAAEDFDAAVALRSDDYDLYLNIYERYRERNLSGLGGAYLQSALDIQGEDTEHCYNRGRIYYYLENYEEAQRQLVGPVEQSYGPAMNLIGRVYLAMKDYEHARMSYAQLEEKFGKSVQVCNGLALCEIESGNYDAALEDIAQGLALETGEDCRELYFNEIVAYERKQDFVAAKAKAQEYVQRYPGDEAGQREWTFLSTR